MDSGISTLALIFFIVGVTILSYSFGKQDGIEQVKTEAIQRGHASFCPLNGEWAWNGECEAVAVSK